MSLVELRHPTDSDAVSGGAMDKVVVRKTLDGSLVIAGAAAAVLALILLFWFFAPRLNALTVARDRLGISDAQAGRFDDFVPVRATVTPLLTVYLDAVKGGQVQKKLVEGGAQVVQGQLLAVPASSTRKGRRSSW